ncbi:hypothetical protein D3C71_1565270 [compost metagenome]
MQHRYADVACLARSHAAQATEVDAGGDDGPQGTLGPLLPQAAQALVGGVGQPRLCAKS